MKTFVSLAGLLAYASLSDAQIAATLNRLPNGMDEVRIRNNFATNLVAYVVTVKEAQGGDSPRNVTRVFFSDPLIDAAAKPLLASEERVLLARALAPPGRGRFLEEPIIAAGILGDGTAAGDAPLLTRLILRRANMLLAVETALDTLSDAGRRNVPRHQLTEQFRKMAESLNRWYLPPEQQVGGLVYQSIMGKLLNLPEQEPGAPFPPNSFVAQETATLNRQRVALLESQPSLADAPFIGR